MQNNIKNNDLFSKQVRQKLESHQTPVEPAIWKAIEAKMAAGKEKKRIPLGWWLTAGMAAAVALLLTLSPFTTQTETELAQTKKENNKVTSAEIASTKIATNTVAAVTKQTKKKTANFRTYAAQPSTEIVTKTDTITASNSNNAILATNIEKPRNKTITKIAEKQTIAQRSQPNESVSDTTKANIKPSATEKLQPKQLEWEDPLKEKNKSEWELIAMVGGTGKTSQSGNAVIQTATLRPRMSIVKAETASAYIFSPEEFSDKTYMAPVTLGFAISRKVSKKLAIETGVNYSYLLTNFKNNQVTSALNLHYMGIPARFTYRLTTGSKWNMYAGAGGMVEKGLWSVYVQKQNYTNQTITTTVSNKIDGFQWSVNAALGGEYTLAKSAAIYFEPKISYYFDNNQPLSTRTENKLVIGFEGGLRYKF